MKWICLFGLVPMLAALPASASNISHLSKEGKIAAIAAEFGASETCVRESLLQNPDIKLAKVNCGLGAGGPIIQCNDDQKCCRVGVTAWCCGKDEACGDLGDCVSKKKD